MARQFAQVGKPFRQFLMGSQCVRCPEQRLAVNKGAHEAFSRRRRLVLAVRRKQAYPEGARESSPCFPTEGQARWGSPRQSAQVGKPAHAAGSRCGDWLLGSPLLS
ncbi:hypothetical protein [Brasilonema bromeliae]|uniref:hypothetical protein n=1 Tax=Brasilonema bromeliae TaxID=383615 RepID=UPI00145E549A|nr:hypothetical protein [Brasilonema bromeliae]